MLIDPITKFYEPCPWCGGGGCLSCDQMRVQNAELQRRQIEAGEFLREYLRATGQPEDTPISVEVALLVINAIEHGKQMTRRDLPQPEKDATLENRFTFIEFAKVQL
jgi:hypothetical protein